MSRFFQFCTIILLTGLGACASAPKEAEQIPVSDSLAVEAIPLKEESATIGKALITVDESLKPLVEAAVDAFELSFDQASIEARYLPGEQAIREMLTNDSVRLVIATRRLSEEENSILQRRNIQPTYANILRDGIALIVHPDNPVSQLSRAQMTAILTGEIKQWNEILPEAPEKPIIVVFDHAESSVIRFLEDSVLDGRALLENRYAQSPTTRVFEYVNTQPQALGLVGYSWISDSDDPNVQKLRKGVGILNLEKPQKDIPCKYEEQFFGPWQSYLDQECYPLSRNVNTILRELSHGVGTGFVSYLDGPKGQRLIHKSGLATTWGIPRRVKLPPIEGAQDIRETPQTGD